MDKNKVSKIIQGCAMLHSIAGEEHITIEIPAERTSIPWVTLTYLRDLAALGPEMNVFQLGKVYRVTCEYQGVCFAVENVSEPYLREYGLSPV